MKIKMGTDTFNVDENIILEEFKNILYDSGRVSLNSVNRTMAIHIMQNASKKVKTREMKKILAELIVALSTSDNIQFIKEDTKWNY